MIRKAHVFASIGKRRKLQWILQNPTCKKLLQEAWLSTAYHIHWVKGKKTKVGLICIKEDWRLLFRKVFQAQGECILEWDPQWDLHHWDFLRAAMRGRWVYLTLFCTERWVKLLPKVLPSHMVCAGHGQKPQQPDSGANKAHRLLRLLPPFSLWLGSCGMLNALS